MDFKKVYEVMKFAGIMLAGSLVLYAGIVEFIILKGAEDRIVEGSGDAAMWRNIFVALSVSAYMVIYYIKNRMLRTRYKNFTSMVSGLYVKSVVILILCQVPAVLGLVQFFIGAGNRMDFYPFMIISALFFIIFFPRYSEWESVMKESKGGSG